MISILIPIYNFDSTKLVYELQDQAAKAKIEYEIICYDDLSKAKFKKLHRILDSKMNVSYIELSENLGRAKIRNWLGKNARYENLLFLDCDSRIEHKRFLKNYLKELEEHSIVAGGRVYPKSKPRTAKKYLHDLYGKKRESKNLLTGLSIQKYFFTATIFASGVLFL